MLDLPLQFVNVFNKKESNFIDNFTIYFVFSFLTIKNGTYILTNQELSQAQDVRRSSQIITNKQCQSKIS